MIKTAIVTGATGQDGSFLCSFLLEKGYRVIGTKRRTSIINTSRIDKIFSNPNFILEYYDLNDSSAMYRLINKYNPDEIYNLAAQSHVKVSFEIPENTVDSVAMGSLRILEAIRNTNPNIKFYQASSSEMFGDAPTPESGYTESSLMAPASPYACAKLFSHNLVRNYRHSYGIHASSGILFNHESEVRGETFVTRKITLAAASIKLGIQDKLYLGNIDAKRDWGYAKEYVEAMWLMLQQEKADDYVIATGESKSVKEFLELVFDYAGLDPYKYLEIDSRLFRPHEVPYLLGNSQKANTLLNWKPKCTLKELAKIMYESDYKKTYNKLNGEKNAI
jgi:GDPmannose 4,6-dehydratase